MGDDDDLNYNELYAGLRDGPMADADEKESGPVKAKGELGINDLPPIEDLTIKISEAECVQIGHVSGIVETLGMQ